jgi:tetratricopeptide (TPR) repeat protein
MPRIALSPAGAAETGAVRRRIAGAPAAAIAPAHGARYRRPKGGRNGGLGVMGRFPCVALVAIGLWLGTGAALYAAIPRQGEATGVIVDTNGDEEIQFVAEPNWRAAEIEQGLLAGDHLRTGPAGLLALRFVDQTVIRVHRNSALVIKQLGGGAETQLQLDQGLLWAREAAGGSDISVSTPSATAAIRGTDWSLSVDASGKTTLIVAAGQVELKNDFGQVLVSAGEAAIAEIGRAPAKIFLAQAPGREQMMYYVDARTAFTYLPLNDLGTAEMRAQRNSLHRKDEAALSDEERVALAELALRFEGTDEARRLLAALEGRALSPDLAARRQLVIGMIAGTEKRWDEAAAAFAAAEPALSGRRRLSAVFGQYVALALGGHREEAAAMKPQVDALPDDAYRALADALLAAVTGDTAGAITILDQAEKRFPSETYLPVFRGFLAVILADEAAARAASERADALDPSDPSVIQLRAVVLSDFDWDIEAAQSEVEDGLKESPGATELWNGLGLLRSDQGDNAGARDAFLEAIRLDPYDPVPRGNLAIVYLDMDMLDEAKEQIDQAKALDPSFYVVHLAEGRWLIQQGDLEGAKQEFLASIAANPVVGDSSLGLAITYYQNREIDLALQALDDAERLNPEDPIISLVRTVIALNESQAGEAIRAAKETYRRYQQRGRAYNTLASARSDGSYLFNAFDNLSLSDWGRYYGDLLFNPFDSASHFYQSVAPLPPVTADGVTESGSFNAAIQGLLLEPLASSARNRYDDLFRRPFFDFTLGGNLLLDNDGVLGGGGFADIETFMNDGLPLAIGANLSYETTDDDSIAMINDNVTGVILAGAEIGLSDRLFAFGTVTDSRDINGTMLNFGLEEEIESRTYNTGVGFSHQFGESNTLMGLVGANGTHTDADAAGVNVLEGDEDSGLAALTHMIDLDGIVLRYGAEGQLTEGESSILGASLDGDALMARLYVDASAEIVEDVNLQVGAYLSHFDADAGQNTTRFDPRIGLSWQPVEGHWLRAGFRQDTTLPLGASLAPIATAGLVPFATPTAEGGMIETVAVRWDAEWTERFFTSFEYQHQDIDDYSVAVTDSSLALTLIGSQLVATKGELDMASVSANVWISEQFGAFARGTLADSENEDTGFDLPLVPDWTASFGITWVHPEQIRVSLVENLIGNRDGNLAGSTLYTDATTDLFVTWEPLDRHIALGASVQNIFDQSVDLAKDSVLPITYQAPGMTIRLSGEVRF